MSKFNSGTHNSTLILNNNFFTTLVVLMLFSSCGLFKQVGNNSDTGTNVHEQVDHNWIYDQIMKGQVEYQTLSIKAKIVYGDSTGGGIPGTMLIRLSKDSVIWASISTLFGEIARILVTPDSIKFLDRSRKQVTITSFYDATLKFPLLIDFETLESTLTGNVPDLNIENELNQHDTIEFKGRVGYGAPFEYNRWKVYVHIYPNDSIYKIFNVSYNDPLTQTGDIIAYDEHILQDGQLFPKEIKLMQKKNPSEMIHLTYLKIKVNEPQNYPFKIPTGYEIIK